MKKENSGYIRQVKTELVIWKQPEKNDLHSFPVIQHWHYMLIDGQPDPVWRSNTGQYLESEADDYFFLKFCVY